MSLWSSLNRPRPRSRHKARQQWQRYLLTINEAVCALNMLKVHYGFYMYKESGKSKMK